MSIPSTSREFQRKINELWCLFSRLSLDLPAFVPDLRLQFDHISHVIYCWDMETFNNNHEQVESKTMSFADQLRSDLQKFFEDRGGVVVGSNELSKLSGINERQLQRYYYGDAKPSPGSTLKIYKALYPNAKSKTEFENSIPSVAFDWFKTKPCWKEAQFDQKMPDIVFKTRMMECSVFRDIYIRAGQSNKNSPLTREYVTYQYGKGGLEILEEMRSFGLLTSQENEIIIVEEKAPTWDAELLHFIGTNFAKTKVFTEKMSEEGENYGNFWAAGVNKEAYNKILRIFENAVSEAVEISLDPKNSGDIKYFQSIFIDTGSKNTIKQNTRTNAEFAKKNLGGLQ